VESAMVVDVRRWFFSCDGGAAQRWEYDSKGNVLAGIMLYQRRVLPSRVRGFMVPGGNGCGLEVFESTAFINERFPVRPSAKAWHPFAQSLIK
jgi:hypothetical protein